MSRFTKASREQRRLKIALIAPTGHGKTRTGLQVGCGLAELEGGRLAVIDTEGDRRRGSASIYAGDVDEHGTELDFDVLVLKDHEPRAFVEAVREAEREGYAVVMIDSVSHAWFWLLNYVDQKGGKFQAWKTATPMWRSLLNEINECEVHIIATMRAKVKHEIVEDSSGRKTVNKLGVGAEARAGAEYEFDLIGEFPRVGVMELTKARAADLAGTLWDRPGANFAYRVHAWANSGTSPVEQLAAMLGDDFALLDTWLGERDRPALEAMTPSQQRKVLDYLTAKLPAWSQWVEQHRSDSATDLPDATTDSTTEEGM